MSACLARGLCRRRRPPRALPALVPTRAPAASLRPLACRGTRNLSTTPVLTKDDSDPRLRDLGKQISDEFAVVREHYDTPKNPIVLAHGLMGFAELRLGSYVPPIHYWHGISDALRALAGNPAVITAAVPPSGSIEERAAKLGADIAAKARGRSVNIIAHSMGGLDARYMISHLKPADVDVKSLVTVATPHRGSAFADFLINGQGPIKLANLYGLIERAGLGTKAFGQLTREYMEGEFNPNTPDSDKVRHFSYGACTSTPPLLSPFRQSHRILEEVEGANDGLVSVASSQWGDYKGTLVDVSHLDLINWSNRVRWTVRKVLMGQTRTFNAVAFYLDIADMLAKEGL
ncbi:Lipase 2 [Colletotrichum siamense]|uniref:Lipase 2 n=1 Tax=Colletotrichum siamense TaxID=690259 RepID=UPI0018721BA9|nr:Lipase 2 [Colletotrichum siamense]KAF5486778.1 Lipase 2 [Colletotrichum siamense]